MIRPGDGTAAGRIVLALMTYPPARHSRLASAASSRIRPARHSRLDAAALHRIRPAARSTRLTLESQRITHWYKVESLVSPASSVVAKQTLFKNPT